MKNKIYISGPITDNETGLPREGWQKEFREAERRLKDMGFTVITPEEVACDAEEAWRSMVKENGMEAKSGEVPRHFYLLKCIERLAEEIEIANLCKFDNIDTIIGLYVIGSDYDVFMSYGTMTEINFALSAGLNVWSQNHGGCVIDNGLRYDVNQPTLWEVSKALRK